MLPSKALVIAVAAAAIGLSQTAEAQARERRQRASSGFNFPASVGSFRRSNVVNYTPDGSDKGASYSGRTGLITAYVYPVRRPYSSSLAAHFEECRREIRQLWGRTRSISKRQVSINRNGRQYPGMEEVFSAKIPGTSSEAVSTLLVFHAGDRYVKFRFTSPKALSRQAPADLAAFIQKFPWPREAANRRAAPADTRSAESLRADRQHARGGHRR